MLKVLMLFAGIGALLGCTQAAQTAIIGPEIILRGPNPGDLDNQFSSILLPDLSITTFTGNGNARMANGGSLLASAMTQGPIVIPYGTGDTLYWLEHVGWALDGRMYGLVHQEDHIDYANNGQTHKSMNLVYSSDYGATWTAPVQIITSPEGPITGQPTGDGDCSVIDVGDGYLYGYCLRAIDFKSIFVRAAKTDLTTWVKYYAGSFSQPGIGGLSTAVGWGGTAGYVGTSPAFYNNQTVMTYGSGNSVYISYSNEGINFTTPVALFTTDAPVVAPVLVNPYTMSNILVSTTYCFYAKTIGGVNYLAYRTIKL